MGNCGGTETQQNNRLTKELDNDKLIEAKRKKLLLLGPGNSGKSTFFKQLLQIHGNKINEMRDYQDITKSIYDSIIIQVKALIQTCDDLEYDIINENELKSKQYILGLPRDSILNDKIAKHIDVLWKSEIIKKAFDNRQNLSVVDSTPYFLNDIFRISSKDYKPTNDDVLLIRTPTTGVIKQHFTMQDHHFTIYDVGGQRSERTKWIHCFDSVTAVLFVASLSCYDQALFELDYINAMKEALNLFDEICNSRWFKRTAMILFLNKSDLFKEKIKKKSLKEWCFSDYDGDNSYKNCVEYVRLQFQNRNQNPKTKQIYSHITCATDMKQVKTVFNDVQHIVVNLSLERGGLL